MHLWMIRGWCYPADNDPFNECTIRSSEDRSYIMDGANVVKYNCNGVSRYFENTIGRGPNNLFMTKFTHLRLK